MFTTKDPKNVTCRYTHLTKTPVTNKVIKIPVALNDIAPIAQIDCGRM